MPLRYKTILLGLLLALGLLLHIQQGLHAAWYLYAAAGLLVASHLLLGNVAQAWHALQRGDQQRARRLLETTFQPDWLLPAHRGRYYLTAALLALHHKDLHTGQDLLQQALQIDALPSTDRAIALLNLAHIQMMAGRRQEAAHLLDQASRHAGKQGPIQHQIRKARALLAQQR